MKLHHEMRMMSGYVLSVDKSGPRLPPRKTDVPAGSQGVIQMGGGIWSRGATIEQLAFSLTLNFRQPVLDRTQIEGNYDFRLRFDDGDKDDPLAQRSVFGALHEIGLKLESQKIPIDVLVIDSAEMPSPH